MLVMHDLLSLLVCQERIAKETSSLALAKVVWKQKDCLLWKDKFPEQTRCIIFEY